MDLLTMVRQAKKDIKRDVHDPDLHWMAKIDRLMKFKELIGASEREMARITGLSKTEINRMSKIYRLPHKAKIYAVKMNVDKWAMVEITRLESQDEALKRLYKGLIKTRRDVWNLKTQ